MMSGRMRTRKKTKRWRERERPTAAAFHDYVTHEDGLRPEATCTRGHWTRDRSIACVPLPLSYRNAI